MSVVLKWEERGNEAATIQVSLAFLMEVKDT